MNYRPKVPTILYVTLTALCAAGIALVEKAKHTPVKRPQWPHRLPFLH